ncbi:FecR family protein [Marinifilum sp. D737]|uniref:FecR family protein n=1 Tax=Marinifilum sp. D737 TaxID=2969628 RepID=UPI002274F396|nr:FecR domain-containing protein [Marinifilum sp. D737]MCY1636153.1 FecR domain-containing protein [Marinifilum sp. D737]
MKEIYYIAKLISKEKVGDLTVDEQQELAEWKLKNESSYMLASDLKQIQKKHELYGRIDQEKSWEKIASQVPELKTKVIRLRTVMKWAAIIMLPLLATTYMLNEVYWTKDSAIVEAGSSKATLELSNGKTIYLEDYQGKDITSGKEKLASNTNNELVYQQGDAIEKVLKYNTIKTPIQGEYYMQLSDGTRIWLNAQTEIQFPEKFGKGKREVKLISGEAYFAVAKEKERPFDVYLNDGSKVEVLGTEFNVMAYQDESEIQTTLVEGSVQFSKESKDVILKPGEQVGLNLASNKMEVREVRTSIYTAWKDGKFVFNREPMESVLRKMSRWYGVKVICDDEAVLKRRISGVTDRYEDIDKLINLIEEISPIDLELEDDHLLVSRKVK